MVGLVYCDYIANLIKMHLAQYDAQSLLYAVGPIKSDLSANGAYVSPTKNIPVTDINGNKYVITVRELPNEHEGEEDGSDD